MKYIKIIVFTMIVMSLVLFAIRNQEKVNFVLGYKTTLLDSTITDETVPATDEAVVEPADVLVTEPADVAVIEPTDEAVTEPTYPKTESVIISKGRTIGFERSYKLPLYLILFVEAFIIVILMSLVGVFENFSLRQRIRDLTKETKKQKTQLNAIRESEKKPEKPIESKSLKEIKTPDAESPQEKKLLESNKKETKKKESKKKKSSLLSKIKKDKASEPNETDEDTNS